MHPTSNDRELAPRRRIMDDLEDIEADMERRRLLCGRYRVLAIVVALAIAGGFAGVMVLLGRLWRSVS